MAKEIEYALVDMDGDPATWVHQDDTEIPLVASSLYRLLDQVGDWCDCGLEYVLDNLDGEIFTDSDNDGARYKIVRHVIATEDLNADDITEIGRLRNEYCGR